MVKLFDAISENPQRVSVDISGNSATAWDQNLAIVFLIFMQATTEHQLALENGDLTEVGWLFFVKAIPKFPPSNLARLISRDNPAKRPSCAFSHSRDVKLRPIPRFSKSFNRIPRSVSSNCMARKNESWRT
jgi:hypothetical protein